MVFKLLIVISLIGNICYADEQAIWLDKDKTAPWSGFLIKEERVKELRNAELDARYYKLINESLEKTTTIQKKILEDKDKQINIVLDQNDKLATSLKGSQTMNNWERAGYFVLGILATYATFRLAKEATK